MIHLGLERCRYDVSLAESIANQIMEEPILTSNLNVLITASLEPTRSIPIRGTKTATFDSLYKKSSNIVKSIDVCILSDVSANEAGKLCFSESLFLNSSQSVLFPDV